MKFFSGYDHYHSKEKLRRLSWFTGLHPAIKRKVIMQINFVAFLVFMGIFNVNATTFAQSITATFRNAPLKEVLAEVSKQSGYELIYNNKHFVGTHNITVSIKNKSLTEALELCLKDQPITYTIIDKTIVLKPKPDGIKDKIIGFLKKLTITGKVTDENGHALPGVNVRVKGTDVKTATNDSGFFSIDVDESGARLLFSFVGFQSLERTVIDSSPLDIILKQEQAQLEEVGIVSTGYQQLPKERAAGSFIQIDNKTLNRRVSTNLLERLNGITTGFYFRPNFTPTIATSPNNKNTGITIRGVSTYSSSTEPLIVLDNFPYEGEISNINPNDIESITVLKDAAAASIWGARSGNGVIVITTKKGKRNEKMSVDFNSNVTVINKPDLFYDHGFMNSSNYIEVEQFLFDKGFFNSDILNTSSRPTVSPAVELFAKLRAARTKMDSTIIESSINTLKNNDVRKDFDKYIYQAGINQQYSLAIRGGTDNITYALSGGYDNNRSSLIRNGFNRLTLNTLNTYRPIKNLEFTVGVNYGQSTTIQNNQFAYGTYTGTGGKYNFLYPYARLADDYGNPLSISRGIRESYLIDAEAKGFLDWHYRPLDDIAATDNNSRTSNLLTRFGLKYRILPQLYAEVSYQGEHQTIKVRNHQSQDTYYTKELINRYSVYNPETKSFTYNFPLGGILSMNEYDWRSNNIRGQLNYDQSFSKHNITAILGSEIRELKTVGSGQTMYGYDEQFGTSIGVLNFQQTYPTNPNGSALIPSTGNSVTGITNRYISYYFNAAYNYDERYTLNLSGRRDGANLFGARTNDRVTPLWSLGIGWTVSNEHFYKSQLIPYLHFRATYGFNGNVFQNGSALLTGRYFTSPVTGGQYIANLTAPNPDLKWERVKNINLGLDFAIIKNVIKGSVEFYLKDGRDLIQPTALAPQTGFVSYTANTAATRTKGWDISLTSSNLKGQFQWNTTLLLSSIKDKVVKYDAPLNSGSISSFGGVVGKPLFALFAYKWAGLNPQTGSPIGFLGGKEGENYSAIINNFNPDSLVFAGSQRPTFFGAIRNDFIFKGFSLSVNVICKLGYVFRRPSINLNYTGVLTTGQYSDFGRRWQQPGDELKTNVPSLIYPNNTNRNTFYQYSEVRIEKGDHIRIQDIRLGYEISKKILKIPFDRLQVYAYADNLGIIWRKNKYGLDPDALGQYPNPFSLSFGLSANF